MKIFNNKTLGLLVFIVAISILLRIFLLDWLVEKSIEYSAGKILKTHVQIDDAHLSISGGELSLNRLLIADKNTKGRSVFATGKILAKINIKALLRAQLDVEEIRINDIEIGAGFISESKSTDAKKKSQNQDKKKSKIASYYEMDEISDRLNIDNITNLESLTTFKRADEASLKISQLSSSFNSELENPELDNRIKKLSSDWELLEKNQPQNISDYPAYLSQVSEIKTQMTNVYSDIDKRKNKMQNIYKQGESEISAVQTQSETDLQEINNKIDQISSTQESFLEDIVGDRYMGYVKKAQTAMAIIKKLKKDKTKKASWKDKIFYKGEDVSFTLKDKKPKLLIEKVLFSGWWGEKDQSNEFLGVIDEISSDQRIRNITTKMRIKSKEYSSIKRTDIRGELDSRVDDVHVSINIDSIGNKLESAYWDESQIPFNISSGNFGISGNVAVIGDYYSTIIQVNTDKTKVIKSDGYEEGNLLNKMLAAVVENNERYLINVSLRGDQFAIDSNLDDLLSKEYTRFIDDKKRELKEQVEETFKALLEDKTSDLNNSLAKSQKQLESSLKSENKKALSELNKINREIKKIEKKLKREQDKLKDQVQKEGSKIQDSIKKGIQNFFK